MNLKECAIDAIRYWEPRRLFYNGALAVWTLMLSLREWIEIFTTDSARGIIGLFVVLGIFVVLANFLYCAAYFLDIPFQLLGFRERWKKLRSVVFVAGVVLACICVPTVLWWPGA